MSHAENTIVAEPTDPAAEAEQDTPQLIEDDSLVEEISIDGMCGVY